MQDQEAAPKAEPTAVTPAITEEAKAQVEKQLHACKYCRKVLTDEQSKGKCCPYCFTIGMAKPLYPGQEVKDGLNRKQRRAAKAKRKRMK
jgi:hypothetical protein